MHWSFANITRRRNMPTVDEALAAARTALDDLEAAIGAPAPVAAPVAEAETPAEAVTETDSDTPAETETQAEDAASTETDTDTVTAPASELAPDLPKGVQQ